MIASVQTSEKNAGAKALQVHFKDGDGSNGPDFRIITYLVDRIPVSAIRWYQKWDANWKWSPGQDHKLAIAGPVVGAVDEQRIYFNIRGQSGGTAGYPAIYLLEPDSFYSDQSLSITPGSWHLLEMLIVWGANGSVRIKVDGVERTLTHEAGGTVDIHDFDTGGAGMDFLKLDTTYNNFGYFEANVSGDQSNTYYDDVAVADDDWIGGV